MKRFKSKKNRGPVRAKKASMDGIQFRSGLEKNTYIALKEAGLFELYEVEVFQLIEGFTLPNICIEKQANGKGELIDRGQKKVLGIKYTPDFIGEDFIIETKGRANESFPMRWKLFKQLVTNQFPGYTIYKPQNQAECDETVRLILGKQKG